MSRIRDLLADLEDPWPLRRRKSEIVDSLLHGSKGPVHVAEGDPALEELSRVSKECAAREARWSELAAVVEEGPVGPPPSAADLAELERLRIDGALIAEGYAPGAGERHKSPIPGLAAGAGAGVLAVCLVGPLVAVPAAQAAQGLVELPAALRRYNPGEVATAALDGLDAGCPAGEPSADAVRAALDGVRHKPRDRRAWNAFLEAADERVGVLRRRHLRARAEALLAQESP